MGRVGERGRALLTAERWKPKRSAASRIRASRRVPESGVMAVHSSGPLPRTRARNMSIGMKAHHRAVTSVVPNVAATRVTYMTEQKALRRPYRVRRRRLFKAGKRAGGRARVAMMTPEEHTQLGRKAATARWSKARASGHGGVAEPTPR